MKLQLRVTDQLPPSHGAVSSSFDIADLAASLGSHPRQHLMSTNDSIARECWPARLLDSCEFDAVWSRRKQPATTFLSLGRGILFGLLELQCGGPE